MPDKPDNVMIQKWMPQYDILCKFEKKNAIFEINFGYICGRHWNVDQYEVDACPMYVNLMTSCEAY